MFLDNPRFPQCLSFGFVSEPIYVVAVIERASGLETRNRSWSRPLYRYTATLGPRIEDDVQDALEFYHAMGGRACGFRFQDHVDYKSCRVGRQATAFDQPAVKMTNYLVEMFQLVKDYTYGTQVQRREIYKPVADTILLADDGVVKVPTVDYVVNDTNGLVELNFTPVGDITWGGEFDVPVRFDSEFPVEIQNRRIQSASFTLRELRMPENY